MFYLLIFLALLIFLSLSKKILTSNFSTYDLVTSFWSIVFILILAYSDKSLPVGTNYPQLSEPGSLTARTVINISDQVIRRLLEPSIWIFFFIIINLFKVFSIKKSILSFSSLLLIIISWVLGSIYVGLRDYQVNQLLHYTWILSLLLVIFLMVKNLLEKKFSSLSRFKDYSELQLLSFSIIIFLSIFFRYGFITIYKNEDITKGVHYYSWFPENWSLGYGTVESQTCYKPKLNEYNSRSPEIIKSHLKNIQDKGIDLLIYDWWPTRRDLKDRVIESSRFIKENSNLKFAVHFESLDIQDYPKTNSIVTLNSKMTRSLVSSFDFLAKELFPQESYFKIDGKPVVFMYATRHLVGNVARSIFETRKAIKKKYNLDLYLIGDEAYFHVPTLENKLEDKKIVLLPEYIPDWNRLKSFDAIGLYNPYDPTKTYPGLSQSDLDNFFRETEKLYTNYQYISSTLGIPFFPAVIPSYNDKKMRPKLTHEIIPDVSINGERTYDILSNISEKILGNSTSKNKIITITSWNEWNEGTQIEEKISCNDLDQE